MFSHRSPVHGLLTVVGLLDVDAVFGQSEAEIIHGENDSVPVLLDGSARDLGVHPGIKAAREAKPELDKES